MATMSPDDSRAVSAGTVRDILIGGRAPKTDPLGLRIRGAWITGRLDLDNVRSEVFLELTDCHLPAGLTARNASLPAVTSANCRVEGNDSPAVDLTGAAATDAGGRLMVTGWALQLLAWAFGSLFIADFTSAVRKT